MRHLAKLNKEMLVLVTSEAKYWPKLLLFVHSLFLHSKEEPMMNLNGVQVDQNKYPSLQWNTTQIKGCH